MAIGAGVARAFDGGRLGATVLAFFLAVGLAAHALDELRGRPLRTAIPDRVLWVIASVALAGAVAIGVVGAAKVSWWLLAFVGFGLFIVPAYNLEVAGGLFHSDLWFAVAWGAFPALTGYFAQAGAIRWEAVLVALACLFLSAAQRTLSSQVRHLRRRVAGVTGQIVSADGRVRPIDERTLLAAPEKALRALTVGVATLAAGLVVFRLG